MPEVKPERVLSFSSEDKAYPANNLLKVSAFSKWKCQQAGAKHASVTFKFACPIQFSRIDIGNEASAFISVEVSRADSSEFELLLPSSSFMSPSDAKKGVSLNRVRIFSGSELTPSISSQKWDIVRVNCTQPFNTESQYGLAFVRFYRTPDVDDVISTTAAEEGRNPSKESGDLLKPGGLFRLARKSGESQGKSAIANVADVRAAVPSTATQKLLREKQSTMDSQGATALPAVTASVTPTPSTSAVSQASSEVGDANSVAEESKRARARGKGRYILDGVVVAFSGYKNPFRSELRDMCLRLGAKYRQDWTDDCTHLICAFPNTPKWNAVKGRGIITSHKWIQACNAAQRRVSWRPYRVGRAPSPVGHVSDGNDDVDSDWEPASYNLLFSFYPSSLAASSNNRRSMVEDASSDEWRPDGSDQDEDESDESSGLDVSEESQPEGEGSEDEDSPDRGEESKAHRQKKLRVKDLAPSTLRAPCKNVGDEDTDEEVQRNLGNNAVSAQNAGSLPPLPNYFSGRRFFIFSKDFDAKEQEIVYRLIIAFKGTVEPHMSTDVEFVVSRAAWCKDFDEALEVSSSLIFVKPEWIYACDRAGKIVPFQRYQIVG
ncbi:DNA repair protein XRCC1 [Taenia crassiceps]|uniref:DNA repair protein XRCC1 n=1 Tax=Taenia crassiceps TaxID=6207 RepID=A0ABR4QNH0_9CEST